ncbi:MAG: aminotransferase class V-fold PLP-dependent enzyme, partial [Demequinaceae bacterium]|nr:aminotransferase class V-fold PLP-dependent enzyme [Demequinaceae bacterium]
MTMPTDIRSGFPILTRTVRNGKPLVYLDSAATSQRPRRVLDAVADFEALHNGAVQRGAHLLAEEATELFEAARASVARLVGARED